MTHDRRSLHRSIPGRIFLGFLGVLVSLTTVAALSLVQHARTVKNLRLLQDGYLPLSLGISEARATQGAFTAMVERSVESTESAMSSGWLEMARRVRPLPLRRALGAAEGVEALFRDSTDAYTLRALRSELEAVLLEYELSEDDFDSLHTMGGRSVGSSLAALVSIRQRERNVQIHLARAWSLVSERIASTARRARDEERRTLGLLVGLGLVAFAVGLAITFWSLRVLSPLTRLAQRVAAVARGDLAPRVEQHRDDEIGRVAEEFERMVRALSARDERLRQTERLAAVGRISAHVTHEVRNPLNSIRLNVEMLEEDLATASEESRKILAAIAAEVQRLTAITEQYLRLARLPEPKLESALLEPLIRDVLTFLGREMEKASIKLELELAPCPEVLLDEAQLRQALLNLCRNAREAMPAGGTICVELRAAEQGVLLAISDQGPGIAADERDKIFDLFYTTKQHGTGLGLPLTQQIVLAHGGRITCHAVEPHGTRFELWLPLSDERAEDKAELVA